MAATQCTKLPNGDRVRRKCTILSSKPAGAGAEIKSPSGRVASCFDTYLLCGSSAKLAKADLLRQGSCRYGGCSDECVNWLLGGNGVKNGLDIWPRKEDLTAFPILILKRPLFSETLANPRQNLTEGRYGVGYLSQGRGSGFRFREKPQFREGVISRAKNRPIVQATAEAERHLELGIGHVHAVIDLDKIAVDETGGRVKARRRNLLDPVSHPAGALKSSGF